MTTYTPNPLVIGELPVPTHRLSISGSGTALRGTPIKSADGLAGEVAAAPADIATVIAVLPFDVDLSGGAVDVDCYAMGDFSSSTMPLGTITVSALNASLRTRGIPIFVQ